MEKQVNKLLEFQKRIGTISKDLRNPHFKNTYASLTQILSEVKPLLNELGLTLLQPIDNGKVCTIIMDGALVIASSSIDMPTNLQPQPLGSAITYFRRYTLASLLALEIADDDDANGAKPTPVNPTKEALDAVRFESMIKAINIGKASEVKAALSKYTVTPQQQTAIDLAIKENGGKNV
jgi:hypothetical protein